MKRFFFIDLLLTGDFENRFGLRISATAIDRGLIKECCERIVFFLGKRVIFMIVTSAAIKGETHQDSADGLRHIEDVVDAIFLRN